MAMNPKLIEAVKAASGEAFRRSMVESNTIWSEEIFIAALREQGVVVTWAEPDEGMKAAGSEEVEGPFCGPSSYRQAIGIFKAMIQASQQE